jgi:hypothetical protein
MCRKPRFPHNYTNIIKTSRTIFKDSFIDNNSSISNISKITFLNLFSNSQNNSIFVNLIITPLL